MRTSGKIAVGLLVGIAVIALSLLVANSFLEKKLKNGIENNLDSMRASYEKVDVKLLNRSAEISNAHLSIKGKQLSVDLIRLENINLYEYIVNKNVEVGNLMITQPEVKIFNLPENLKDSAKSKRQKTFKNKILLKNVQVTDGSLKVFEKDSLSHRLYTRINSIKLSDVKIDSVSIKNKVPFMFDIENIELDSLYYDLDELQNLSTGKLKFSETELLLKNLQLLPKYSKTDHQRFIIKEKDRYVLSVDSISMDGFDPVLLDAEVSITSKNTSLSNLHLEIYRDKLKPDDSSYKPLYSKLLRELPVKLQLDHVKLTNGYIKYEERMHADREPGLVDFSNLSASLDNITNIGLERKNFPLTIVKINTRFMGEAPLAVDWRFRVNNRNEHFNISGEMGNLSASKMNQFLTPAMNVEAEGEILSMYFNFEGNTNIASGDMRLEYKDFKVDVLQKDQQKKNKLISALANLLVKNKALNEKASYKEIKFERDKTKSFWNYLWNLVRAGALKTFL